MNNSSKDTFHTHLFVKSVKGLSHASKGVGRTEKRTCPSTRCLTRPWFRRWFRFWKHSFPSRRRNPSHPLAAVDYQVSAELSTFVNPVPVFASPSAHGIKFILGSERQERAKFEFVRVSADFCRAIFSHGPTPGGPCAYQSVAAIDWDIETLGDSLLHRDSSFCVGLEGQSDIPVESKQRTRPSIYFCTVAVLLFFFFFWI